jgi:hypothetical protein
MSDRGYGCCAEGVSPSSLTAWNPPSAVPEVSSPVWPDLRLPKELGEMSETRERDAQRERAAKNQSLFREVNERTEDLARNASFTAFICECMNETCDKQVSLTVEEYEHVRSDGNRFFVLPGHELAEVERIIEANDRFVLVAKVGAGAQVAEQLDPRKRS